MKHEEITKDIIGAAMAVLNGLKPGLDEKLYENAQVIELAAHGHLCPSVFICGYLLSRFPSWEQKLNPRNP